MDHDDRQTGHGDGDDEQHGQAGTPAGDRPEFGLGDFRQRLALMLHRSEEHHGVVYRTANHGTDQQPYETRQVAELGGQHRADQRPGGRNGGKVLTGIDPFFRGHVILAILELMRWRNFTVVGS